MKCLPHRPTNKQTIIQFTFHSVVFTPYGGDIWWQFLLFLTQEVSNQLSHLTMCFSVCPYLTKSCYDSPLGKTTMSASSAFPNVTNHTCSMSSDFHLYNGLTGCCQKSVCLFVTRLCILQLLGESILA